MTDDQDKSGRADEILEDLKVRRDELRVRMNLAGKEARDEWDKLEERFEGLRQRMTPVGDAASETIDEVGQMLDKAADELKKGYERLKDMF
ncbi:MAG: hypothetical protein ABFS14_10805 [Gemmatimonadota bacterium]